MIPAWVSWRSVRRGNSRRVWGKGTADDVDVTVVGMDVDGGGSTVEAWRLGDRGGVTNDGGAGGGATETCDELDWR